MLTEEQKAELIKRHATTYRNRHVDTKALGFTEADLNALIADVEQAVRKEMEGDAKDAERYRWLRSQHEGDDGLSLSVFAPRYSESMGAFLTPVGSMPGELDAAIDAAKGQTDQSPQAHQPLKAPWDDFAGNPIHEGDTIRHPADGSEGVVFVEHSMLDSAKWRVRYHGLGGSSSLMLQIGDKGQAVVVKKAAKGQT
jgi:hypothetical protein